jgi:glycosyltransferase involved in cell wall biosynthesis
MEQRMMRVLLVTADQDDSGTNRQLSLLATNLSRDRFAPCVCFLRGRGPLAEHLREAGIECICLGWKRLLDVRPLARLRRILSEQRLAVIHAWGMPALRACLLLAPRTRRVLASSCRPAKGVGWLDRRLLRRAARVVSAWPGDAKEYLRRGVPAERVVTIAPAVAVKTAARKSGGLRARLGLAPTTRLLACVGPFAFPKGYRDVLWALDIVQYVRPDLHLVLAGTGPDLPRLSRFVRTAGLSGRVHALGRVPDVPELLDEVDVVCVPSHTDAGVNVALEALAAGRPLIAGSVPPLREIVRDGETGLLFPPGDKGGLARQLRRLVDDPELSSRLGEAGHEDVAERFPLDALAHRYADLYHRMGP